MVMAKRSSRDGAAAPLPSPCFATNGNSFAIFSYSSSSSSSRFPIRNKLVYNINYLLSLTLLLDNVLDLAGRLFIQLEISSLLVNDFGFVQEFLFNLLFQVWNRFESRPLMIGPQWFEPLIRHRLGQEGGHPAAERPTAAHETKVVHGQRVLDGEPVEFQKKLMKSYSTVQYHIYVNTS